MFRIEWQLGGFASGNIYGAENYHENTTAKIRHTAIYYLNKQSPHQQAFNHKSQLNRALTIQSGLQE
ncbi:hypothetical protein, partial [Vibrio sp. 10N.222.49.C9]